MIEEERKDWYRISTKEVFERLAAREEGLSTEEAGARLEEYGPNRLAEEGAINRFRILLHQFTSPLIYILLVAAAVTVFLKEYVDMGVILSVVALNAVIGYFQEYRAERSVRALKKMLVPRARVLRDGRDREVDSVDLVPGDVVIVSSGGKVPADLRLFRTVEFRVDEALLTGESAPVEKHTEVIREDNLTPGDQKNMAFTGTVAAAGRAKGIVVETGPRTVIGQIAEEVQEVSGIKTPLQDRLERFARLLVYVVLGFSAVIFFAGTLSGRGAAEMFMVAVATAVSAVPEGLPVAVTIAMAIGVSRMAQRNAIIRKLPAVETLGSTTIIGSDKTGTLTKNEMTVRLVHDGEHVFEVTGSGYEPVGEVLHEGIPLSGEEKKRLQDILRIGLLCNESEIYEEDGTFRVEGDPTEGALIVAAMKAGLMPEETKDAYPQVSMVPFESDRGYMATLNRHRGKDFLMVKGAPERVVDMCAGALSGRELNAKEVLHAAASLASEGLRVLAMAEKEMRGETAEISPDVTQEGLLFAGLVGMMDPPRPEAADAVAGCSRAGIRTVMITGDHAVTAMSIAKKIGIGGDKPNVIEGREIEGMSDEELYEQVGNISVFARVAPHHKHRIVRQLLEHGEVVAVTGDGVNDAPALKAAHIGVAMGRSGTDVAKEASDMVLTDDNFASIFAAVEEGRVVYDNVRKVTLFLVSCGFGELVAITATLLMGLPIPYIPAQILWLNLVTNGFQDVAIAFEPGEAGVLDRKPRPPKEGVLSSLMVQRTLLMGVIMAAGTVFMFVLELQTGVPVERARTVALTTMVFFQFYQALNCRSEQRSIFRISLTSNPFLIISIIAAFYAQLAVLYVPAFQWIFRTVPLTVWEWVEIGVVTIIIVIAVEIDKWIRGRKERSYSMAR